LERGIHEEAALPR